mmetsp:Transcript_27879/g.70485  ORF Transcript_27879/g.70485 Transcript_27879/m.70485 type:complete len:228 (-) Transcript_27879:308-991(-)
MPEMADHDWDAPSPGGKATSTSPSSLEKINPDNDYEPGDIKIILLGDSAVGKSKLIERYLLNAYTKHTASTYAVNIFSHKHTDAKSQKEFRIDFWDTAGQEQFSNLHPSYYYEAHCCILAFDVTRKITYKNLEKWYENLRHGVMRDIPIICIANKIDFDPTSTQKKFQFAVKHKLPFFYVSAADGTNVVRIFEEAIALAIKQKENPDKDDVLDDIMALLAEDDNAVI